MIIKRNQKKDIFENLDWKNKDANYLRELQRFLDMSDLIENKEVRQKVVAQMLKCDNTLTELCQEKIQEIFKNSNKKDN